MTVPDQPVAPPTGPGYLVDAIDALAGGGPTAGAGDEERQELVRRLAGVMVDFLVRDPAVDDPPVLSVAEDLATMVVVDAAQRALAENDVAGCLRAVALSVPITMRFARAPAGD